MHFLFAFGILHWIAFHIGIFAPKGAYWYNFWSGFGSDLTEFALIGALLSVIRKHNCHVKGCWRLGAHEVDGTPYVTCKTHHPDIDETVRVTPEVIAKAHAKAQQDQVQGMH